MAIIIMVILLCCGYAPSSWAERDKEDITGQVVLLYDDKVLSETPSKSNDRNTKESPEVLQEKILNEELYGEYTIEESIVLEGADDSENIVIGTISSDSYSTEELMDALRNTDGINRVEPNYRFSADSIPKWNDRYIKDAWQIGEKGINADKAPKAVSGSDSIVIAVMDSGIAYDHPDINTRMWTAPATIDAGGKYGLDCVDYDDDPYDEDGHGTHCAGIIAAAADNNEGIAGVAGNNNIELMAVRVLDDEGSGYFSDIIKGYEYLIHARKQGIDIRVVNCSFASEGRSSILESVIDKAGENGILTVAAAGNETIDNDTTDIMPAGANSSYVISVAATDEDGKISSYSNYGKTTVDIAAPGSNILSSVSYNNYTPYLYPTEKLRKTTKIYGEFGNAIITNDPDTGEKSIAPVSGTDYDGEDITGIGVFGMSKMYTLTENGSRGNTELSITNGNEEKTFPVGNNKKCLRWTINNMSYGDKYILYFPYEKSETGLYTNIVFRTHTDINERACGTLHVGDVIVAKNNLGELKYSTSSEEKGYSRDIDNTWNSTWEASGMKDALYTTEDIEDLNNGSYGLGFVYEAWTEGSIYIDISSLAISTTDANEDLFGSYDIYSGTSMSAPVVTGAVGLVAAAEPRLDSASIKNVLLKTSRKNNTLANKCLTGAELDFSSYMSSGERDNDTNNKATPSIQDEKTETATFIWDGKKLKSKVKVRIKETLAKSKTPKSFNVNTGKRKATLKWKKVVGVSGYIVFRKTGKGSYIQIKKLPAGKNGYVDKTVKKGKKYSYIIVSYKNAKKSSAVIISHATKTKTTKKIK